MGEPVLNLTAFSILNTYRDVMFCTLFNCRGNVYSGMLGYEIREAWSKQLCWLSFPTCCPSFLNYCLDEAISIWVVFIIHTLLHTSLHTPIECTEIMISSHDFDVRNYDFSAFYECVNLCVT